MDETSFDPSGAKGANRTRDTALFRRVLYRLSYLGSIGVERTACRDALDESWRR
jgi:hypothetical protein